MNNFLGTQMHWLTLALIALETMLLLLYEFPRYLEHPEERHRPWFMLLLLLLIHYNLWNGLLPDPKDFTIPIKIQYMILDGIAYMMGAYFPFYFYKAFDLPGLRFYATYGVLLFLLLPYAVFVVAYAYNGQLLLDRLVCLTVPAIYGLVVLVLMFRAIHLKSKQTDNSLQYMAETGAFIAILPWEAMCAFAFSPPPQELKIMIANLGFIALAFLQVTDNIRHARQERRRATMKAAVEEDMTVVEPVQVSGEALTRFEENCKHLKLTRRETEIVLLLRQGLTYQQIADQLHISKKTVANHVTHIYEKTRANTKFALFSKVGL
jgi:DNA-binding CsgD family transcriptional regulator